MATKSKKTKARPKLKAKTKARTKTNVKAKAKAKPIVTPKVKSKPKAKTTGTAKTKAKAAGTPKAKVKAKPTVTAKAKSKPKARPPTKTPSRKTAKKPLGKRASVSSGQNHDGPEFEFTPYKSKRGEPYMSEGQHVHFRQILQDWKRQLMEEVDRMVNHMQGGAGNDPDPADRATYEEEFSMELKTRDRERKLIRKIDSTLDLLDLNDYGYCESCGVKIGIQRLEARPTATLCIDCKTLAEIKERQIHG